MRSVWNGSLSFGLVNIPVKLYGATEDRDVAFHQVHEADGGRIRYQRVCEICGATVEYADIAKSYDSEDGQSVILTDEDFSSLPADASREIAVQEFVPADQIDPMLFDRSYYLEPTPAGAKAYVLLRTTLQNTERVAVVRFALRQRTRLAALRVHGDVLAVQTMRWPDEVREFEISGPAATATVTAKELKIAQSLVDAFAADFAPEEYTDDYRVQLQALIDAKLEGGEAFPSGEGQQAGEDAEVLDLLAALERSVQRRSSGAARAPGTKPPAAGAGKKPPAAGAASRATPTTKGSSNARGSRATDPEPAEAAKKPGRATTDRSRKQA